VPFAWHVSDYATRMSRAMFRDIGAPRLSLALWSGRA
jgi:hypothetical protein